MNVAIIGSGSWGVALAIHLAKLGHNIKIWSFDEEEKRIIKCLECISYFIVFISRLQADI